MRGACTPENRELFFSPDNENLGGHRRREAAAKQVCAACPVTDECLIYALATRQEFGVWGGFGEDELRQLRGARPRWAVAA
jgi:WhiB family redox-sensing transcriptional regulator